MAPVKSRSRHEAKSLEGQRAGRMPPFDHPAMSEARTIYPKTRRHPTNVARLLKSGMNSAKIGAKIQKGKWKGFPVYTLTLEERATCPASCRSWRSCYGNSMHWSERMLHGKALEDRLEQEVAHLADRFPGGFVIRLHVLGDFYSVDYVRLWATLLVRHDSLRVFGYTARIDARNDPIAAELVHLTMANWGRFAMRFSNAPIDECSTVTIEHPFQCPDDAVICPAQLGLTQSCSTCALCWSSKRRVAFIQH